MHISTLWLGLSLVRRARNSDKNPIFLKGNFIFFERFSKDFCLALRSNIEPGMIQKTNLNSNLLSNGQAK
jgi:hypothetical protein